MPSLQVLQASESTRNAESSMHHLEMKSHHSGPVTNFPDTQFLNDSFDIYLKSLKAM